MVSSQVLRFDRSDEQNCFVLVNLVNNESDSLDLTLTATEGEGAYTAKVKQANLKALRSKSYQGSEDEWFQIIRFILGQSTTADETWLSGLEATATVKESEEEGEIIITIRKRVQDITQRLGAIVLKQDDETIELFEWAGTAASRNGVLQQKVTSLTNRYQEAEDKVQRLNQQLEDLLQAKSQQENQMMANFTQLLNEKKLKIRNQQRLLASSNADPAKRKTLTLSSPSSPNKSNQTKLKQTQVSEIQALTIKPEDNDSIRPSKRSHNSDTEESDDFEPMDLDNKKPNKESNDDDEIEDHQSTPPPEGNTTTDDESEDEEPIQRTDFKPPPQKEEAPPPRRELPFTRRGQAATKSKTTPQSTGEETGGETDDDEL
ncbi:hypothetical protein PENSTE_c030G07983 [Penicillium steckii]|uniref:Uncharacterized protein n=1 Tax=Penicillium steckii TaxID=303698 RepID=A0A1V6SN42_9EURO|nr:hypothetical protein PENSTE_c030G07983 [Penicillium steckii]